MHYKNLRNLLVYRLPLEYFTCFNGFILFSQSAVRAIYPFHVTLSNGLQQVTASTISRLRLRFGSRASRPTTTRGRRGSKAVRWGRRARWRGRRRRRWWTTTCRHRRGRGRRNSGHRGWRRGNRWGRIGSRRGGERRRGRWGVEARRRRGDPKARGWRRGRRCRGRGKVGAGVGRGRGHGGSRRWVVRTQHADTLLGWCSVLSVIIPASNRES